MEFQENTFSTIKSELFGRFSTRARNILKQKNIPLDFLGINSLNMEELMQTRNCGIQTAKELMLFKEEFCRVESHEQITSINNPTSNNVAPYTLNDPIPLWQTLTLSRRSQTVIATLPPKATFSDLKELTRTKKENIGFKTQTELNSFINNYLNGKIEVEKKTSEQLTLPLNELKNIKLPKKMQLFFKENNIKTLHDIINLSPYSCRRMGVSLDTVCQYRNEYINKAGASNHSLQKNAENFQSLSDFVLYILKTFSDFNDNQLRLITEKRCGYLNVEETYTLEEVASFLNITRERVRQLEKEIEKILKQAKNEHIIDAFLCKCKKIFQDNNYILNKLEISEVFRKNFSWSGTTSFSIIRFLIALGLQLRYFSPYIMLFSQEMDEKFKNFSKYMLDTSISFTEKDYKSVSKRPELTMTKPQYVFFINILMEKETNYSLKELLTYYRDNVDNSLSSNPEIRKEAILAILRQAGWQGLSDEDLIVKCTKQYPNFSFSARSLCNTRKDLLDNGKIILFQRGANGPEGESTYTLAEFFDNEDNLKLLIQIGSEIRNYMKRTGFGIISLRGYYEIYKTQFSVNKQNICIPFGCFRWLLGKFKAGGLNYLDSYSLYPTLIDNPDQRRVGESVLFWLIYLYFKNFGKLEIEKREIKNFLRTCLQISDFDVPRLLLHGRKAKLLTDEILDKYTIHRPSGSEPIVFVNDNWKNET